MWYEWVVLIGGFAVWLIALYLGFGGFHRVIDQLLKKEAEREAKQDDVDR